MSIELATPARTPHLSVQRQMRAGADLLPALAPGALRPARRRAARGVLREHVELDRVEALQEAHEEERHLVVRELLPEADARARVEGQEDERVRREVLVQSLVEEAVRVELLGCADVVRGGVVRWSAEDCTVGPPEFLAAVHALHRVRNALYHRGVSLAEADEGFDTYGVPAGTNHGLPAGSELGRIVSSTAYLECIINTLVAVRHRKWVLPLIPRTENKQISLGRKTGQFNDTMTYTAG